MPTTRPTKSIDKARTKTRRDLFFFSRSLCFDLFSRSLKSKPSARRKATRSARLKYKAHSRCKRCLRLERVRLSRATRTSRTSKRRRMREKTHLACLRPRVPKFFLSQSESDRQKVRFTFLCLVVTQTVVLERNTKRVSLFPREYTPREYYTTFTTRFEERRGGREAAFCASEQLERIYNTRQRLFFPRRALCRERERENFIFVSHLAQTDTLENS